VAQAALALPLRVFSYCRLDCGADLAPLVPGWIAVDIDGGFLFSPHSLLSFWNEIAPSEYKQKEI